MFSAEFSADGYPVVTASWSNIAKNWNVATGECKNTLAGHSADGAGSSSNAKTLVEAKELFRQGLFLEDIITAEEFSEVNIMNVRQEDFQQMAELNIISKAGSKDELAKRILV